MRISDWSSDVCSSDLLRLERALLQPGAFIFLADRLLDPRRDRLDLPVDLVDLRLQLLHRRICLEMLGAFLAQRRGRLRARVEQILDRLVGEHVGDAEQIGGAPGWGRVWQDAETG